MFARLITALLLCSLVASSYATDPVSVTLWPDGAPEKPGFSAKPEQKVVKEDGLIRISDVSVPTISVYKPKKPNGTAVLVCPGGGYNGLAYEHEGTQFADYLNTLGVTGIVLKYRVPRRDPDRPHEAPLADARRAMQIIRSHATEWEIKSDRVGILGFSAGGNLCLFTALTSSDEERPNFVVAVYPAYLTREKDDYTLRPDFVVTKQSPPACFIHAGDDRITAAGSALLYLEYKKAGVPAEMHVYATGGHGFGMKPNGKPVNQWHVRVADWMKTNGWID